MQLQALKSKLLKALSWWKQQAWFKGSVVGLVAFILLFGCCLGGLGFFVSIGSSSLDAEDYAAATEETKREWAREFDPAPPEGKISWEEYQEYSAGLMNWLEFGIIPMAYSAALDGDSTYVDRSQKSLWNLNKMMEKLHERVEEPRYGGTEQTAQNFRSFLPTQKISRDRTAVSSTAFFVGQLFGRSGGSDQNVRRMLIDQYVDSSHRSVVSKISSARNYESKAKREWGIVE